jgi:hypothetical protein
MSVNPTRPLTARGRHDISTKAPPGAVGQLLTIRYRGSISAIVRSVKVPVLFSSEYLHGPSRLFHDSVRILELPPFQ